MTSYQIADGNNNAAGLQAFTHQPSSTGIRWPYRIGTGASTPKNKGSKYVVLRWQPQITKAMLVTILTEAGVLTALYNDVTVKLLDDTHTTWGNYNGRIVRPFNPDWDLAFFHDIELEVWELVAL